jgi:hypothetical protein
MNIIWKKAWYEFRYTISQISDQDNSTIIFQHIRSWYQNNKKFLSSCLIKEYQIDNLINIDIKSYPIDKSECTAQDIKRFLNLEPSSEDTMIMFLRDQLWELVLLSVEVQCRRCGKLEMSVLFDTEQEKVILECTQCGLIHTVDGYPDESVKNVRLAQNDDLISAGLI